MDLLSYEFIINQFGSVLYVYVTLTLYVGATYPVFVVFGEGEK